MLQSEREIERTETNSEPSSQGTWVDGTTNPGLARAQPVSFAKRSRSDNGHRQKRTDLGLSSDAQRQVDGKRCSYGQSCGFRLSNPVIGMLVS